MITQFWNGLSIRHRRNIKIGIALTVILFFIFVSVDYFRNPHHKPDEGYSDHSLSYIFFGLMGVLGTLASWLVFLEISSKEANTMAEYLDIFNEILESVRQGEKFYILSPAHNAGERDTYSDNKIVKQKYALNQKLLLEKAMIAQGEYTLLAFLDSELTVFTGDKSLNERTKIVENYIKNTGKNEIYSPLFKFLMKFSKDVEGKKKDDDHIQTVRRYMQEAYNNLERLIMKGLKVRRINKETYLDAPMVLIISDRIGYFGQYKVTEIENKSTVVIRGIKIVDEHGIKSLQILYDAIANEFTDVYKKPTI